MIDYFFKLKDTRGVWIFLLGAALVLMAPLPLKFDILKSGNQGNPLGTGFFFAASAFVGASTALIGCLTFTIEIILQDYLEISSKNLLAIAFCAVFITCSFITGRDYLDFLAGAGPYGPNQTEVFAKTLGLSKMPTGFRYSDLTRDGGRSEFKLIDATGFGSLTVKISPQSGLAANTSSCAKDITAKSVTTRTLSFPVRRGQKSYRKGAERALTFLAANRSYSLSTQAIDPLDTTTRNYKWKEPEVHSVPVDIIINVAKQLCSGAGDPKRVDD